MRNLHHAYEISAMWRRIVFFCLNLGIGASLALAIAYFGYRALSLIAFLLLFLTLGLIFGTTKLGHRRQKLHPAIQPEKPYCPEAVPIQVLRGSDKLLFCIHGFPATPADFRRGGDRAVAEGWDFVAPLLPGCGTKPSDILSTDWDSYLEHVRSQWKVLRPRYKIACIIGISIGGSLALSLAEEFSEDPTLAPTAIATVGTPVMLNSWLRHGIILSPAIYFTRFLGLFIPAIGAGFPDPDRVGEDGDSGWKGYIGLFPRQIYSLQVGLTRVHRNLSRVLCPILISHSRFDRIIPHTNALAIAEGVSSPSIEILIVNMDAFSHARHNLFLYDSQGDKAWTSILGFFARQCKAASA